MRQVLPAIILGLSMALGAQGGLAITGFYSHSPIRTANELVLYVIAGTLLFGIAGKVLSSYAVRSSHRD